MVWTSQPCPLLVAPLTPDFWLIEQEGEYCRKPWKAEVSDEKETGW